MSFRDLTRFQISIPQGMGFFKVALIISVFISTYSLFGQSALSLSNNISLSTGTNALLFIDGDVLIQDSGDSSRINNQGVIQCTGNWSNFGSGKAFTRAGQLFLNGTSNQQIFGTTSFYRLFIDNTLNVNIMSGKSQINHTLQLVNGNLITNNDLIINSDEFRTARIDQITSGNIIGEVIVERFIDSTNYNYRFVGMPVQSVNLTEWLDDFIMTGFTGSQFPSFNFNSIEFYNEATDEYDKATNITNTVGTAQGVSAYLGNEDLVIDSQGLIYSGNVSIPVTFTDDPGEPLANDGWNLVANPYASTIDWDNPSWTKTNIDNAIYIYDGTIGAFSSYVGGVSTNGGTRYIASSQAFFVKANAASPVLGVVEAVKSPVDEDFIEKEESIDVLRFKVCSKNSCDETVVRIEQEASDLFESEYDALKFALGKDNLSLSSILNGINYSILSINDSLRERRIDLDIGAPKTGEYSIIVENIPNQMECVYIMDYKTNSKVYLEEYGHYTIDLLVGNNSSRFQLGFNLYEDSTKFLCAEKKNNIITDINELDDNKSILKIYPNPAKDVLYIDGSSIREVSLLDLQGRKLIVEQLNGGVNSIQWNISKYSSGIYIVQVFDGESFTNKKIQINR